MSFFSIETLGLFPGPGMLFGLMLVAGIVGGYTARLIHMPRVVGFLLAGVALRVLLYEAFCPIPDGPEQHALEAAAKPLKAIKDLALGLILFTIGSVFERSKLRATRHHVLRIALLESSMVLILVFAVSSALAVTGFLPGGARQGVVLALLLAVAAIATAPAATLLVLQEYEAKGPLTDTILGVTGLNNIICIVVFHSVFLILASLGVIDASQALGGHLGLTLISTTVGSVVLGIVCGVLISILHAKMPLSETLLFFFALFIILGAGESYLWEVRGASFNFLLTSLVIGAVFSNIAIDSQKLHVALRTVGSPIFAGFFVIAGYGLHFTDIGQMGWLGVAYIGARVLGKSLGCRFGVKWAHAPARAEGRLGPALLCQAAVVIGLASFVEHNWDSELATRFASVVLGSVVVFELLGPLFVKRCVVQGGEVKAITLVGGGNRGRENTSIVRITLRSLWRSIGWSSGDQESRTKKMCVEHIMRTNVQFLHSSSTFDEVLHFIEHSTHSHFTVVQEDGGFAGVIHFSDVRDVIYDPSLARLIAAIDLADPDSPTVPMNLPLGELLKVFTEHNVGVLPVVERAEGRRVVGIVEQRDLLRAMHLSRTPQPGE